MTRRVSIPRLAAAVLMASGLALGASRPALADGTALVRVTTPVRGAVPTTVAAFGEAAPASIAVRSLTLAQSGQVVAVLVTAGQAIKRGQPLLRFATAPSAVAAYRQAQTALKLANDQQTHTALLLSEQLATRDQMAAADKALADARVELTALAQEGAATTLTTLRAPFDGVVVAVPPSVGDRPAAGASLVTLAPSSALQVTVGVEPGWRSQIHPGQSARLAPVGGGPSLIGRVVRVDDTLNPKTRLVDVDIATPIDAAISGEAFKAQIEVGEQRGWLIPHGAVRVEGDHAFVFQIAGGKAVRVDVTVRQPGRDTDVVDGPIDAHRPLVTIGAYQLDDGDAVRLDR